MSNLVSQVQTYLEIYDPLGMGELAPLSELYGPVSAEIAERLTGLKDSTEAAEAIHRVLFLTYGSQAGHPRNYGDLGRDLLNLAVKA